MRRWLFLSAYHWAVLLVALGICAALVAFFSFELINLAVANFDFLSRHRLMAVREGGLVQLLGILARASFVLIAYLMFKAIETELIIRWRAAAARSSGKPDDPHDVD
jgi:hypothetical protein